MTAPIDIATRRPNRPPVPEPDPIVATLARIVRAVAKHRAQTPATDAERSA